MLSSCLLVFSADVGERVRYACSVLLKECAGIDFELTNDDDFFKKSTQPRLSYHTHRLSSDECFVPSYGLLAERHVAPQTFIVAQSDGLPAFFFVPNTQNADFSFDLLALAFYLVSRYEEYLPTASFDAHRRFSAAASLASQHHFLHLPLVNLWALKLRARLQQRFPELTVAPPRFQCQPTYDIDMAWAFRHKGFWRTAASVANDLLRGRLQNFFQRVAVQWFLQNDPYDTFASLDKLHKSHQSAPIYFFLVGDYDGKYDKNISFRSPAFRQLIQSVAAKYEVGLHPSYQSNENKTLVAVQKQRLEEIIGLKVTRSRQHFLKLSLPSTYQQLLANKIYTDFSMGYAEAIGFRASVAVPFFWYDLTSESVTNLKIHPFCAMDVTLRNYLKLSPQAALGELRALKAATEQVGGTFSFIWHNSSFYTSEGWAGWAATHEQIQAK